MPMTIPFAPLNLLPLAPFLLKGAKDHFGFTREKVKKRIAQGDKERPDFMARVLKYNTNDGNEITVPEIESTFELLAIAGSENNCVCRIPRVLSRKTPKLTFEQEH